MGFVAKVFAFCGGDDAAFGKPAELTTEDTESTEEKKRGFGWCLGLKEFGCGFHT